MGAQINKSEIHPLIAYLENCRENRVIPKLGYIYAKPRIFLET
jgi:hypothetical protein